MTLSVFFYFIALPQFGNGCFFYIAYRGRSFRIVAADGNFAVPRNSGRKPKMVARISLNKRWFCRFVVNFSAIIVQFPYIYDNGVFFPFFAENIYVFVFFLFQLNFLHSPQLFQGYSRRLFLRIFSCRSCVCLSLSCPHYSRLSLQLSLCLKELRLSLKVWCFFYF